MPFVVTADDITAALIRTDAQAKAIDDAVNACQELPASTKTQWADFLAGYRQFSADNKDHSFLALGLPNIGNEVVGYEHELNAWATKIQTQCPNLVVPQIDTHDEVADRNDDLGFSLSTPTTVVLGIFGVALLVFAVRR